MLKKIKLTDFGVDRLTRYKLKEEVDKLNIKGESVVNVKYDIISNRFYIVLIK